MIQIVVGLSVTHENEYAEYRRHMTPLLHDYGGRFVWDVVVDRVLKSPEEKPLNRLFSIEFPSQDKYRAFFDDPDYLAIRARHFDRSVSSITNLGRFEALRES